MIGCCTTKRQSDQLRALGFKLPSYWLIKVIKTIDEVTEEIPEFSYSRGFEEPQENSAWGISEILEVFPEALGTYRLRISKLNGKWDIRYINNKRTLCGIRDENLYNAAIELIKVLVRNRKI